MKQLLSGLLLAASSLALLVIGRLLARKAAGDDARAKRNANIPLAERAKRLKKKQVAERIADAKDQALKESKDVSDTIDLADYLNGKRR